MRIRSVWVKSPFLAIGVAICFVTNAQTRDFSRQVATIQKAPEAKLLDELSKMAQGFSKNTPAQIDRITVALGAIFVRDTKTFIYKYESSESIDPVKGKAYLARGNCGDPVLKAFMQRGVTFRHQYIGAAGQFVIDVTYHDCI